MRKLTHAQAHAEGLTCDDGARIAYRVDCSTVRVFAEIYTPLEEKLMERLTEIKDLTRAWEGMGDPQLYNTMRQIHHTVRNALKEVES